MERPTDRLNPEQLFGAELLSLRARMLAEGMLAGIHRSPRRGSCPEFREFRAYQRGDELRDLDWRASARADQLLLRIREDETQQGVRLLLDVSRSLDYHGRKTSWSKWEYARTLAAALLLVLHHQGDRAGLTLLGSRVEVELPLSGRLDDRDRMFQALERAPDAHGFDFLPELVRYATELPRRSLVIVLSDFYCDPAALESALAAFPRRKSKALLFHVLDPAELELEWETPVLVRELESEHELLLHPDERRDGFRRAMKQHLASLREATAATGNEYAFFNTALSPISALGLVLHQLSEVRR